MFIETPIILGSYLAFPFIGVLIWLYRKKRISKNFTIAIIALSLLFIYSRFIERYIIITKYNPAITISQDTENLTTIKIAVISDTHIGAYKSPIFLKNVVTKLNRANPDLVLIAGDLTEALPPKDINQAMMPLENIKAPTYVVLGNHDYLKTFGRTTGELTKAELFAALSPHVNILDNEITTITIKNETITLAGLGDPWGQDTNYSILENLNPQTTNIVLAHNPDVSYQLPNQYPDLLVSGHTHGGQIRIPFIYHKAIPSKYNFNEGFYEVNGIPVFVTAGLGEVGLPMRLGIPPRIDILEIKL